MTFGPIGSASFPQTPFLKHHQNTAAWRRITEMLEKDFYSSDARVVAANLQEMEELVSAQFKRKHPTVAEEIVEAFAVMLYVRFQIIDQRG